MKKGIDENLEISNGVNKYLNYYRERRRYEWEKDPIGLIVCEYKEEEEVHFALGGLEDKIFVAEYKAKLPTEKEIKTKLRESREKLTPKLGVGLTR